MDTFFQHKKYLFIFAHPDDEIYTCAFLSTLVNAGKDVDLLYVTSGDYQGPEMISIRESELTQSMQILNVKAGNVHLLRIPERKLMDSVEETYEKVLAVASQLSPDCIIGHDFEGGHNGHDAISFVASRTAEKLNVALYVFPAYNGWPQERQWNQFASTRTATDTLLLTPVLKDIQDKVISAHSSQQTFFDSIMQSNSYSWFSSREVLSLVSQQINYLEPPTTPVGYEYPNSRLHFNDFREVVVSAQKKF